MKKLRVLPKGMNKLVLGWDIEHHLVLEPKDYEALL